MRLALVALSAFLLQSCGSKPPPEGGYRITVEAKPDSNNVKMIVTTNLPLPVEVMAHVGLAGQKDDDVYIGTDSERVTLDEARTEIELAAVDVRRAPLPDGMYQAEVSFYPRWGAKNDAAEAAPQVDGRSQPLRIGNTSFSADAAKRRNEQREWVMENVVPRVPWNEASFVERLGKFEKAPSDLSRLHDAYYFPEPDMTLIVNRLRKEVSVWRMGRQTS